MKLADFQISCQPLIPQTTNNFLYLVDRMYEREQALVSLGVTTFQLDQEFIAVICKRNQKCIEEQRNHEIFFSKHELTRFTYKAEERTKALLQGRLRTQETGKDWDGYPTCYLQQFHRLRLENQTAFVTLQNEFNLKVLDSWRHEVDQNLSGDYQHFDLDKIESRELLLKSIFERELSNTGFLLDKKLTRQSRLIYSKPIANDWVFILTLERKPLNEPVEKRETFLNMNNSMGWLSRPLGPAFFMAFGIANRKTRKTVTPANEQALFLEFKCFFPIKKAALWSDYTYFYSLRESEALINIHLKFYRLIAPDFEKAVFEVLSLTPRTA